MKKFSLLLSLLSVFFVFSCTTDPKQDPNNGGTTGNSELINSGVITVSLPKDTIIYLLPGEKFSFNYGIKKGDLTTNGLPKDWVIVKKDSSKDGKSIEVVTPNADKLSGNYNCDLVLGSTDKNVSQKETVKIKVMDLTAPGGSFMYCEGNMSNEMGSVCYISPEGILIDSLYRRANPGHTLGNVCQDMFIKDGKAFFTSQNGGGDGQLVVVDLKSFKRIGGDSRLAGMNWVKFVATEDGNNVYVRDNQEWLWKFNLKNGSGKGLVKWSKTPNIPFISMNDKIYFASGKVIKEIDPKTDSIKDLTLPQNPNMKITSIKDILPSDDGKLWIVAQDTSGDDLGLSGPYAIFKYDINNPSNSTMPCNLLPNYRSGRGNYHSIAVKGNDIFYQDWDIKRRAIIVYKLSFDENAQPRQETKDGKKVWVNTPEVKEFTNLTELNTDSKMVYNAFAVNPVTGNLMIYTLKGYGKDYKVRDILSIDATTGKLVKDYKNVFGSFAAGFCFNK